MMDSFVVGALTASAVWIGLWAWSRKRTPRLSSYDQVHTLIMERAQWLHKEYLKGGNFGQLKAREEEALYLADEIQRLGLST